MDGDDARARPTSSIGMAREHVREAVVLVPDALARTFTLKELVRGAEAIGAARVPTSRWPAWLARIAPHEPRAALVGRAATTTELDVADPIGAAASRLRGDRRPARRRCSAGVVALAFPADAPRQERRRVRVAIGADHAGFELKEHLVDGARSGWATRCSTSAPTATSRSTTRRSAPPSAAPSSRGEADRGIVLGGSGQGEQIAANKVHGVRAALCNDLYTARCAASTTTPTSSSMGGRIVADGPGRRRSSSCGSPPPFEGGRHERRVAQIADIETEEDQEPPDALAEQP